MLCKKYAVHQEFSEVLVGLCEEMGVQPSSELSTTNGWWAELWWKHVPDGWGCNMETPSAELCSCRRDKHVVAFWRTKICPTRNGGDWDADIVEVGTTVLTDTVKRGSQLTQVHLDIGHWKDVRLCMICRCMYWRDLMWTSFYRRWASCSSVFCSLQV